MINTEKYVHKSVLLIAGTRPEVIKLAPLYWALKQKDIPTHLCVTGQHKELLAEALKIFDITPDLDLAVMKPDQDLFYLTSTLLIQMRDVLKKYSPSLVVIQGDTTSTFVGALAAFYEKIPVAHVEAGLRTSNIYLPFPEAVNRQFVSVISRFNFAPTTHAVQNLLAENINKDTIYHTGNTVVDALLAIKKKILKKEIEISVAIKDLATRIKEKNGILLALTAHRRESFGAGLQNICTAIKRAAHEYKNFHIIYPAHPNPAVQLAIQQTGLAAVENVHVINPLNYTDMIFLLLQADYIATDSGGIQEEGVTLGKRVLVLRNETERPEGIEAGLAELVGTDEEKILCAIRTIMQQKNNRTGINVYGDGTAAIKIARIIQQNLKGEEING